MKTRILPVLILSFLVLGCGGEDLEGSGGDSRPVDPAARPGREPATKVVVTSDDASLPDGCHPRQMAGLVIDFIDAFNRGD